jgi:hypothetical protein
MTDARTADPLDRLLNPAGPTLTLELAVLGVPVRFESDSPLVISAIEAEYGYWRSVAASEFPDDHARAVVRIGLDDVHTEQPQRDRDRTATRLISPRWVAEDRIAIETPDITAISDWTRHRAAAQVSGRLLHGSERLPDGLLDTLTLFLLGRMDRQPLHAAAIGNGEAGLLLAGASGSGKSTLAYAAARAGLHALSDDAVYVQLDPLLRVWAMRSPIHLVPEAAPHFPELGAADPILRPNGKLKIAVALQSSSALPFAERVGICLLTRGGSAAAPERMAPADVVQALTTALDPGFDRFADTIGNAIRRIAEGGAWRITVAGTPSATVEELAELLALVAAR